MVAPNPKVVQWLRQLPLHDRDALATRVASALTTAASGRLTLQFRLGGSEWELRVDPEFTLLEDMAGEFSAAVSGDTLTVKAVGGWETAVWKAVPPSPAWIGLPLAAVRRMQQDYREAVLRRLWEEARC